MKESKRICPICPGLQFEDMPKHIDHLAIHNPDGSKWTEAYLKIQAGKESSKSVNVNK